MAVPHTKICILCVRNFNKKHVDSVHRVAEKPQDLESIAKHLGMKSYMPIQKIKTNIIKYKIFDEYLIFYFKFIQPHRKLIINDSKKDIFLSLVKPKWNPWLGFAFENFCLKYSSVICQALKIQEYVEDVGPYFERKDTGGFQMDIGIVKELQNKMDLFIEF